jgi:hypothetical protein
MKEYSVKWEIDVEANSPEEAARKARAHQTRRGTMATFFEVFYDGGNDRGNMTHHGVDLHLGTCEEL